MPEETFARISAGADLVPGEMLAREFQLQSIVAGLTSAGQRHA